MPPEPAPAPPPHETVELIRRHRGGDPSALNELFDRYYDRVFRLVRVELGTSQVLGDEIADSVQDVFLRVTEGIDTYEERPGSRWIGWVATLARNEIRNQRRDSRTQKRGGRLQATALHTASGSWVQVEAHITGVVSRAMRNEDAARVDVCVTRLPDYQRRVVVLRDYEGHDWAIIGASMDRSPAACQQLHARARLEVLRMLRQG